MKTFLFLFIFSFHLQAKELCVVKAINAAIEYANSLNQKILKIESVKKVEDADSEYRVDYTYSCKLHLSNNQCTQQKNYDALFCKE